MRIFGREFTFNGFKVYHAGDKPGKADVGLGNVDNVKQYSASNKPAPVDIGAAAASHAHDDRYYTESEVNTKLTTGIYEANLAWGGKNHTGRYAPIDAAMVPALGANRLAFMNPDAITVEYSRDSGATWTDYGASNDEKRGLFSTSSGLVIGKADSSNKATATYQLRITINTGAASVYTELNKFVLYISTNGSSGCTCRIQKALQASPTSFIDHTGDIPISGWSGFNVINCSGITTYGNTSASQYGRVRFLFKCTGGSATYNGLNVFSIFGYGGVGWSTPSNMAKNNSLFSYDANQNAAFPAKVTSPEFVGKVTGNADSASAVPWSGVSGKPSTYTPSSHNHDNRYYTEAEVDDKITGASGNTVTVSTTAPANPRKGDIWI